MTIREATHRDTDQWVNLRRQLWPDCPLEEHHFETESILSAPNQTAILAIDDGGDVIGFAELSLRNYAEGCVSNHVGYLEGIFVEQESRRKGVARELFLAGEHWALRQGCFEMGSDCDLNDERSLHLHQRAGFSEVERTIHFRKTPLLEEQLDAYCSAETETVYDTFMESDEPWQQSGFSGPEDRWVACRKPIADCVTKSGSFLDIGCANGYLLECLLNWTAERRVQIVPYGIDISEQLVAAARKRLPDYASNIHIGNCFTWNPPKRFDYVRTELGYVPEDYYKAYVNRLIALFLKSEGTLLVAEYHSRDDVVVKWDSETLKEMGFTISETKSGYWDGKELTRISVVSRQNLPDAPSQVRS